MARDFTQLEGLVRMSGKGGIDFRPMLLRALTDLYVSEPHHSRQREQQFCELALRLLDAVDGATRVAVAAKLASYPLAPRAVLDRLAADGREPAPPSRAASLPDPANFIAALAPEPPDGGVPTNPVDAPRQPHAPSAALRADASVAAVAGIGDEFLAARGSERQAVLAKAEAEAAREGGAPAGPFSRAGAVQRLEAAALAADAATFARELVQSFDLPRRVALDIVEDGTGEALAVAAKAIAIPDAVVVRVLLFLNPVVGQSVERVFALMRLHEALSLGAACCIFASWREGALARGATPLQSVHADGSALPALAGLMGNARRPAEPPAESAGERRTPGPRDRRQGTS